MRLEGDRMGGKSASSCWSPGGGQARSSCPAAAFQSPAAGPSTSTTAWSWTPAGSPACRPWSSPRCPVSRGAGGEPFGSLFSHLKGSPSRRHRPGISVPRWARGPSCAGPEHVAAVVLLAGGSRAGGCAVNMLLAEKKRAKEQKEIREQGGLLPPARPLKSLLPAPRAGGTSAGCCFPSSLATRQLPRPHSQYFGEIC